MRITIYSEPSGAGIGGTEYCACVLAAHLAPQHDVVIAHHHDSLGIEQLEGYFGENLAGVSLRKFPKDGGWLSGDFSWWQARTGLRKWKCEIGAGSDCVINLCHSVPPFCTAKTGILYVLFPFFERARQWPWMRSPQERGRVRHFLRSRLHDWLWHERMQSYTNVVSISEFTRVWTKKWWDCDSSIIHPPVNLDFPQAEKQDIVLSLGRFANMKRQREMAAAFCEMASKSQTSFRMEFCGNRCDEQYFEQTVAAAGETATEFVVGASREEVKLRLARAKIFWHAAGLGIDESRSPEQLEHFGIVTAEAMAAGCVPVVLGKGGQPEIVEHGVSGFCWQSLEELQEYTLRLIRDDELRAKMSQAAVRRSERFSKQRFLAGFRELLAARGVSVPS